MRESAIDLVIEPQIKDLGEFTVQRTLPDRGRQRVGPFIFFDHMGPADFPPGTGVNVRAHPHIGIATITYLFAGKIMHRDSLGYAQVIEKGAVNWMTAGKGIVHSERTPADLRDSGSHLHGIQAWVALPVELEETEPRFEHYPAEDVPEVNLPGANLRIIAGESYGQKSPVLTSSETIYVEANLTSGASIDVPTDHDETAVYLVDGKVTVGESAVVPRTMVVLKPGTTVSVVAKSDSKCMILGGATLSGERILWWNFVSSSKERMRQARNDWRDRKFDPVPGESEFIPLPEK